MVGVREKHDAGGVHIVVIGVTVVRDGTAVRIVPLSISVAGVGLGNGFGTMLEHFKRS
jgi:hypothetical protein